MEKQGKHSDRKNRNNTSQQETMKQGIRKGRKKERKE